jgi:cytochrome c-type biogenesis protein CcmH
MSNAIIFWSLALGLTAAALAFILPNLIRDGFRRRAVVLVLAALVPAGAAALYFVFGTPQAVSPASDSAADLAPTSAADYVARLESHLERQPRDARGWVLLGRAQAGAERFEAAARAFEQAVAVSPDKVGKDPSVLCEFADVLAMQQGGRLAGRPLQLVNRALELNARHPMALEMAGSAAYEDGRYADSVRYWSELLAQLRPGSQKHTELSVAVARAQQQATSRAP